MMTKLGVLVDYPAHLVEEWNLYDMEYDTDLSGVCRRCGRRVYKSSLSDWCEIVGEYADDNVLLKVQASDEWLREHADEMSLFPPEEWRRHDD